MRFFICVFVWMMVSQVVLIGQRLHWVQGEVIVQLDENTAGSSWSSQIRKGSPFKTITPVSVSSSIFLLQFDHAVYTFEECRRYLLNMPGIVAMQRNYLLEQRSFIPNDPLFEQQWAWMNVGQNNGTPGTDIGATAVWPYTTGGTTPSGDSIVVALIDNGIDRQHPDLAGQLWKNQAEIPNNQIDDDQNGYIDDYLGWNITAQNDLLHLGSHGTKVAGVINGRGNNNVGIAGLAWNSALMVLECQLGTSSELLQAYDYVRASRQLYNDTNGQEGTLVVVTNTSWGVSGIPESEAPVWCSFFDSLGHAGILNTVAVPNEPVNIDLVMDLPSACTSPFVISVTATDYQDQRTFGAHGFQTVDLAAPGTAIWTTRAGGDYELVAGTSFAAPAVAGAIALMYGVPCSFALDGALTNPEETALQIRAMLLDHVTPVANLSGEVRSGGRLNVANTVQQQMSVCNDCPQVTSWNFFPSSAGSGLLSWTLPPDLTQVILHWKLANASEWQSAAVDTTFKELEGLAPCSTYDMQLVSQCGNATIESPVYSFSTNGCCNPSVVEYHWVNEELCFQSEKEGEMRVFVDDVLLEEIAVQEGETCISGIDACTDLEIEFTPLCDIQSETAYFTIEGRCHNCQHLTYCDARSLAMGTEWIASVQLGEWVHNSGPDDGYGSFSNGGPIVQQGSEYNFSLTPGFLDYAYSEYFQVWIDFDQNGAFDDHEQVVDPGYSTNTSLSGTLSIPETAIIGSTRMRVIMQYLGFGDMPSGSCSTDFMFGEVEDYCVTITPSDALTDLSRIPNAIVDWTLLQNPVQEELQIKVMASQPGNSLWQLVDYSGRTLASWQEQIVMGEQNMRLPLWNRTSGVYVLIGTMNGVSKSESVVIIADR